MSKDAFITEDFLLETEAARRLYHEYAEGMPIIDYHCHLPVRQVADDHQFADLTEIWLAGDHYKWRAMRAAGVNERFCTGDASPWEKFLKWAETVPKTLCNPLYHWSHLELKRPFGISDRLLDPDTAKGIWEACNAKLATPEFSCRGIMEQMDVVLVCTTDDPTDDLSLHWQIADDETFDIQVLPGWRPDKAMAVENVATWNAWTDKLAAAADVEIKDFASFVQALRKRHDVFHAHGCRLSDHGLDTAYAEEYTDQEIAAIFAKARSGKALDEGGILKFKSAMLYAFGVMDYEKDWTQQYHLGAMRNNNARMMARLGPDTGYDSIGDLAVAQPLSRMLDRLESDGKLARTILYNLNPADNAVLATMIGNFQDAGSPGKVQFGSGWWFLDQKDGMEAQMRMLSSVGLLSMFVGMITDSRSFLSYTRHEYFRRILCNLLGSDMEKGLIPRDWDLVGQTIKDIAHHNAARYFRFEGM